MKNRIISIISSMVFFAVALASSVYAHDGDVFAGKYINNDQKNLKLRITRSAQTSIMNSNVYNSATAWNYISSNVNVTVIMEVPGMPTISGCMYVYGNYNASLSDQVYGLFVPFDSEGNDISGKGENGANKDWKYIKIIINTTTPAFEKHANPTLAARANFLHEVGHALKLSHPQDNVNLSGHEEYDGRPYSVMNQGLLNIYRPWLATWVTSHDKSCLQAKWGA